MSSAEPDTKRQKIDEEHIIKINNNIISDTKLEKIEFGTGKTEDAPIEADFAFAIPTLPKKAVIDNENVEDEEKWWEDDKQEKIPEEIPDVCPYLDTVNRGVLDFDLEKVCSISLRRQNVYMCLVCGKYFQGRGPKTYAYTHALVNDHHVFLCLATRKFHCLPENYEIVDKSLNDILYANAPTYTKADLRSFSDIDPKAGPYDVDFYKIRAKCEEGAQSAYVPGIVGLNDVKDTDYANAAFLVLCQVTPIRDFFLMNKENGPKVLKNIQSLDKEQEIRMRPVIKFWGELLRKMMSKQAYRSHVGPHEMMQAVTLGSNRKFQIVKKSDAAVFMTWFLNTLHMGLGGTKKTKSSIIYKTMRGKLHTWQRHVAMEQLDNENLKVVLEKPTEREGPFLHLTLDVPELKLFGSKKNNAEHIIPRVDIMELLKKYNGEKETEVKRYGKDIIVYRHVIVEPPEFLLIYINRFHKSLWDTHKNPSVVMFPLEGLDLNDLLRDKSMSARYDIVANICHDSHKRSELDDSRWREKTDSSTNTRKTMYTAGKPTDGAYRVQVIHQQSKCWFEIEHLHVKQILKEQVMQSESYIQIWKRTYYGPKNEAGGKAAGAHLNAYQENDKDKLQM